MLVLREVLQLPFEHASHHVPLKLIYLLALKVFHHLFYVPICDQSHEWVFILHQTDRIVLIVI